MRHPTEGYLKCYYGYKNFGDEILAFGVINRIFQSYPTIKKLYIEVGNKERFDSRLTKNTSYLEVDLCKLETIQKDNYRKVLTKWLCNPKALKFLGWGEVFTQARGRWHGWWNYLLLFRPDFLRKNVVLLGWLGTPRKRRMKLLYTLTVKNCQKVVVREEESAQIVRNYLWSDSPVVFCRPDFALDTVQKWQHRPHLNKISEISQKTILVNLTPYRQIETDLDRLKLSVDVSTHCLHVYFPCGQEDVDIVWQLKVIMTNIVVYKRWFYDVDTILTFMSTVSSAVWSRLHFIYILKLLGVEVVSLSYQEKVEKFLRTRGRGQETEEDEIVQPGILPGKS